MTNVPETLSMPIDVVDVTDYPPFRGMSSIEGRSCVAIKERFAASVIGWEGWTFRVVSSKSGVRYVDLCNRSLEELGRQLGGAIVPDDRENVAVLNELREYLAGDRRTFSIPIDLEGTPFQIQVWKAVEAIPYGQTRSYSEVACAINRPRALRAVGGAVAANPVPLLIPCHRVIGKDGSLVGYGGGLPLKERFLALEKGSLDL